MKKISAFCASHGVRCIWWLGCAVAVAVTVMRAVMVPLSRDPNTGHFAVNMVVITVAVAATAVMALLARLSGERRVDVGFRSSLPFAGATLLAGVLIGANGLYDLIAWYAIGRVPPPQAAITSAVPMALMLVTGALAVLAGVVLVLLARQTFMERGTRAGMGSWELLIPVLWLWFRLTRYLMSYASAVSLDECIYDFGMFVTALLFVFKFARFVSGIGKTTVAGMMAYAMSAAVWSLSAVLSRACMYVLGDTQAYLSSLAGFSDLAVGVLALVFAAVLCYNTYRDDSAPLSDFVADSSEAVSADGSSEDGFITLEDIYRNAMDE